MPKQKKSLACRLRAYVCKFAENIFTTGGTVLYCKICDMKVSVENNFTVNRHGDGARDKHIMGIEKKYLQLGL